jgi:hypothetical protein
MKLIKAPKEKTQNSKKSCKLVNEHTPNIYKNSQNYERSYLHRKKIHRAFSIQSWHFE